MGLLAAVVIAIAAFILGKWLAMRAKVRFHRDLETKFRKAFPGRCHVCSYHRFSFEQGWVDAETPPAHRCEMRLALMRERGEPR
jgi:hypothetical protein